MLNNENLQQAVNQYLDVFCVEDNQTKSRISNKRNLFNEMVRFLDGRPYTAENILAFRTKKYTTWKTPEGQAQVTTILRALTTWLYKYEYIEKNFADKLNKPKVPRRPQFEYIDPAKVIEIINAGTEPQPFIFGKCGDNPRNVSIKNETRLCLLFLLWTGLRINEALGLSGNDLNFEDQIPSYWVLSKGNKNGEKDYLPIPRKMIDELKGRKDRERIFETTEATCNLALTRGCQKLNIELKMKLTCQKLRHIYATNLSKEGNQIQTIAKSLRHKKVQRTMDTYLHFDNADIAKMNNNQKTVRSELEPKEWIELLEKAIKQTGIEETKKVIHSWKRLKNGGFSFTIDTKTNCFAATE